MTDPHRFRLHLTPNGVGSTIELNGERLSKVRALSVRCGVGEPTVLILEFTGVAVEVSGEGELERLPVIPQPQPSRRDRRAVPLRPVAASLRLGFWKRWFRL